MKDETRNNLIQNSHRPNNPSSSPSPPLPHRSLKQDLGLFLLWAVAGLITEQFSVRIPYTEVFLEGRWIFGFIGFALLQRWWLPVLLAALLAIPIGSSVPFHIGFFGNMLYAIPSLLVFRQGHRHLLDRIRSGWVYAPAWFLLVLFCYQAFLTPAVWSVLAWLNQEPILNGMIEGWVTQPYLLEMILVGIISAALMTSYRSTERLRLNQKHLDHINRILRSISNINQLIVSVDKADQLAEKTCAELAATMGYQSAWMLLLDVEGQKVKHVSYSGKQNCQLPMKTGTTVSDLPLCVLQVLEDQNVHTFDERDNCISCTQSSEKQTHVHLMRRLAYQERVFGVVSISTEASHHIDIQELKLFEEVSNDLEFAFHKISADQQLRESEALYSKLFENMAQGVVYQDHTGRIISANPAAVRILGLSIDQMKGKTSMDPDWMAIREDGSPLPGEEHPAMIALRTGKPVESQLMGVRGPHRKGTAWILVSAVPEFRFGEDRPYRVFATFEDITRLREAEEALAASEARYHNLFESMRDAILITGTELDIVDCNPAFSTLFGYKVESIKGQTSRLIFDEPEGIPFPVESDFEGGDNALTMINARCKRSDGSLFPAELKTYSLRDPEGAVEGYILMIRDVTRQIKAEESRERMEAQLRQAHKMESVGQLAGGIAHDFNNMLSIILGQADLALMDISPAHDLHSPLYEIRQAAERSAELTTQLLAFARKQTIDPVVLDLNIAIEDLLKMLRRLIGEDIDLAWRPADKTWLVKMDPSQLNQVLTNLCVNAREAISGVGHLTIETGNRTFDEDYCDNHAGFIPGDFAMFAVSDDGCGMSSETLDRIFEPFFTTHNGEQKTGLGLSMVYGIVKQNNGFINAYSEPGEGTTFKIYLPRHTDGNEEPEQPRRRSAKQGHGETVLLVEDEPAILELEKTILQRLGYDVIAVDSPGAALESTADSSMDIDLLITDVVMPEMNGRLLAEKLEERFPDIKVLYMSGYTANVIAHRGVLDEGVHFLQKPFMMGDLSAKVREILEDDEG